MLALNVTGSQLSTIATLGSLLFTWADATFVPVIHTPTSTASPLAKIANFLVMSFPPRVFEYEFRLTHTLSLLERLDFTSTGTNVQRD
jgi:hypothetical protein